MRLFFIDFFNCKDNPILNSVTIQNGKIIAINSPKSTFQSIDLSGATVLPGITDSHFHLKNLGKRLEQLHLKGAKSIEDAERAFEIVHKQLKDNDFEPWEDYEILLSNVVVTHDVGRPLNLAHLTLALPMVRTEWEPEQFPGLIFRLKEPQAVCLIFSSGKCVITGNTSLEDAENAVKALEAELKDL